jgi:serine/threonine-protein kinase RsbW
MTSTSAQRLATIVFPAVARSVAAARRWCADQLEVETSTREDVVLLLSEVFTNAVLHSTGDQIEINLLATESLVRIEVVDCGGETVPHYADDSGGEGGRGLPIVQAIADHWGYELVEQGLKVWFEVCLDQRFTAH